MTVKKRSLSGTLVTTVSTCQTQDLSVFWAQLINTEISVEHEYDKCIFNGYQQRKYNPNRAQYHQSRPGRRTFQDRHRHSQDRHTTNGQQGSVMLCYKCGESNHDTNNCKHKAQLTCHHCGYKGHKSWRCLNK